MMLPKEVDGRLRTLEDALREAFGGFAVREDGSYHAEHCGAEVKYYMGIMGPDMAECQVCHSSIRNVLSPHVSPLLIGENCTHVPSEELIQAVGDRQWWVNKP